MRTFAMATCLLGVSVIALAGEPATDKGSLNAAWTKAVKAGDLDGVMKLYAADAVAWFPEEPEHNGAEAIRAAYKSLFDTYQVVDVKLTALGRVSDGKHAAGWGRYSLTLKQKSDGKTTTTTGRFTDVTELRGKHWVYIADHASADPPPPAATK
jgi:uncharacterized protein (TIGR02246 family)